MNRALFVASRFGTVSVVVLALAGTLLADKPKPLEERIRRGPLECYAFVVRDGVPVPPSQRKAGQDSGEYWSFEGGDDMTSIRLQSPGPWSGWYLQYDHRGTDPRVLLSPVPGFGTNWRCTKYAGRESNHRYVFSVRIQAMQGPMAGRVLSVQDSQVKLGDGLGSIGFSVPIESDPRDGK